MKKLLLSLLLLTSGCATTLDYNPETGLVKVKIPIWGRKFDKLQVTRLDDGTVDLVISNYNMEGVDTVVYSAVKAAIEAAIR